jgi:hypothetical protein
MTREEVPCGSLLVKSWACSCLVDGGSNRRVDDESKDDGLEAGIEADRRCADRDEREDTGTDSDNYRPRNAAGHGGCADDGRRN